MELFFIDSFFIDGFGGVGSFAWDIFFQSIIEVEYTGEILII